LDAGTRTTATVENTVSDPVEMANITQTREVGAQYQFDFGWRPAISKVQSKGKQLNGAGGSADLAKYIQAGATYYFNTNMNVWVEYRFNLLDENAYSSSYVGPTDPAAVVITFHF
ncbi:porin, partial [Salmonella enterica]|uniref:porin n=1 Tax=Salmonella enterica TaxID=28901 RepID=UPI00398C7B75